MIYKKVKKTVEGSVKCTKQTNKSKKYIYLKFPRLV